MMVFGKKSMLGVTTTILFALTAACSAATTGTGEQTSAIDDNSKTDAGPKPSPSPIKKDASAEPVEPVTPEPVACPSGLFTKATCQSCFAAKCKAECGSCGADEECNTALTCLNGCTTDSCFDACLDGLPASSLTLLSDILGKTGCVETECTDECAVTPPTPTLKRTGDACTTGSQCETGSCNGSWCSEYCVNNVDCGINSSGALVWCVPNTGGTNTCFPGCKVSSDCYAFPGTTCQSVTANNGASTKVCSI